MPEQARLRTLRRFSAPPRFQVFAKCCCDAFGQRQDPGLEELGLPNGDRADLQIDVTEVQMRDLTYAQSGAVADGQHRIQCERAEPCAWRRIRTSDVQQNADLFRLIDVGTTPVAGPPPPGCAGSVPAPIPPAGEAPLRGSARAQYWNAGIDMVPGFG